MYVSAPMNSMPTEARSVRSPDTGVMNCLFVVRPKLKSFTRAASALK